MSLFAAAKAAKPAKTYPVAQAYDEGPCPPIPLNPVESHKIGAIGYDPESKTLAVVFAKGKGDTYHYPDFAQDEYEAFIGAESLGRHFGEHIQGRAFKKYPAAQAVAQAA
jgi:hypothetical protein